MSFTSGIRFVPTENLLCFSNQEDLKKSKNQEGIIQWIIVIKRTIRNVNFEWSFFMLIFSENEKLSQKKRGLLTLASNLILYISYTFSDLCVLIIFLHLIL